MGNWFTLLAYIAVAIYTFAYSKTVWKQEKRIAAVCISLIAISLIVLPIVVLFYIT